MSSIAGRVLGIPSRLPDSDFLVQAHERLTGERLSDPGMDAELDRLRGVYALDWKGHSTSDRERSVAFSGLLDIAERTPSNREYIANLLTEWPTYQAMMERHGKRSDRAARALLIGSFSALSSRAFEVMSGDLLGADDAFVVDIDGGRDKLRHATFLFGNGLRLPLRDQSMDFAVTNRLIHQLKDPESDTVPSAQATRRLFGEIFRVLAPGGQVLMTEVVTDFPDDLASIVPHQAVRETQRAAARLALQLERAGLEGVVTDSSWMPIDTDYYFDPECDITGVDKSFSLGASAFYARKRPSRTFHMPGPHRTFALGPAGSQP